MINPQIFSLVGISLLAHITLSGGRVASSLFVLQQGYSEVVAGLTFGLYGLMPALLAVFMGKLADHHGARNVMRVCLAIMMIGLLLPALHLSIFSVFICAIFGGLGFGGYIVAAHTAVSLMSVENAADRTGMFAWLQMGTSISAVVGPVIVGLTVDNFNYASAYLLLTCIVSVGFIWSALADLPKPKHMHNENESAGILGTVINNPPYYVYICFPLWFISHGIVFPLWFPFLGSNLVTRQLR